MIQKIFTEVGFGNKTFFSTEVEEGIYEYRIAKFVLPKKIKGIYLRFWIFKKVLILSTNNFVKLQAKKRNNCKILFGINGVGLK